MKDGRLATAVAIGVACAAVALLSSAFVYGTPPDEEEFRFAVLSTWIRVRALAAGRISFWSSDMGLGVPQPLVPHFGLHPLFPLLAAMPPAGWMRVVLGAHAIAGGMGVWILGSRLQLAAPVRAVCALTYLLAAPVQNYILSDFWPSHFIVWTAMPWILLLAWRVLDEREQRPWRSAVGLGLVSGLTLASTNPGHATVYAALVIGVAAGGFGSLRRRWALAVIALCVCGALLAPNAAHLIAEQRRVDRHLAMSNEPEPLPLARAADALLRPFGASSGTRTLFLGAPFSALAVAGCIWFARARADLVITAVIAAMMLFTRLGPDTGFSARYQFRDPLTLSAVLLAGCAASRVWQRRGWRPAMAVVLLAQSATIVASAWPLLERTWTTQGRGAAAFRGATGDTPFADRLVSAMGRPGRLVYSPRVDHDVLERTFVDDGIGVNALVYRGVPVVNGLFKGVSTDAVWPNDRMFYGIVRTPSFLLQSDDALDVLGIRYVLAYRDEAVGEGLREISSDRTIRGAELVLFENADAGPGALVLDPDRAQDLPLVPGCPHNRALCRDAGAWARHDRQAISEVVRSPNEIHLALAPVDGPSVLVVLEMWREGWSASSGGESLPVVPISDAFVGVPLGPGVTSVHLRYRPGGFAAATALAYATIAFAIAVLALTTRRARSGRIATVPRC